MAHRDRLNAGLADVERSDVDVGVADVRDQANPGGVYERIGEAFVERGAGRRVAEAGQDPAQGGVEGFQVVDAGGVVGVEVGVQDGVKPCYVLPQCLQTQLGAGVDQQFDAFVRFDRVDHGLHLARREVGRQLYREHPPAVALLRREQLLDVHAAADGVVVLAGFMPGYDGYGAIVAVEHRDGYSTLYAHLARPLVAHDVQEGLGKEMRVDVDGALAGHGSGFYYAHGV